MKSAASYGMQSTLPISELLVLPLIWRVKQCNLSDGWGYNGYMLLPQATEGLESLRLWPSSGQLALPSLAWSLSECQCTNVSISRS